MANIPAELKYTKEHEWAKREGSVFRVGVTAHAQESLGDVVFVDLPKVGTEVKAGAAFGAIESTKAVSELFAPVSGKVVKVNEALKDAPSTVNEDPYGNGWLVDIEPSDPKEEDALLSAEQYGKHLETAK